jgi:hypothetical protein
VGGLCLVVTLCATASFHLHSWCGLLLLGVARRVEAWVRQEWYQCAAVLCGR